MGPFICIMFKLSTLLNCERHFKFSSLKIQRKREKILIQKSEGFWMNPSSIFLFKMIVFIYYIHMWLLGQNYSRSTQKQSTHNCIKTKWNANLLQLGFSCVFIHRICTKHFMIVCAMQGLSQVSTMYIIDTNL